MYIAQDSQKVALLHTEQRNPRSVGIAQMETLGILQTINKEDRTVADAVTLALPSVAKAVELIVPRAQAGGRLVYVGAGTSGRLGYMDAAECYPTYGSDLVQCVMAGGRDAVFHAVEAEEDSAGAAKRDLEAFGLTAGDVVFAVAASGRTPYCVGALIYARQLGAASISMACNPHAEMSGYADVAIEVDTGAETIMGSTRMKAGTAEKMVMNMVSTTLMIRLGRTWDNLMIQMTAHNSKLNNRTLRLLEEAIGWEDDEHAAQILEKADGRLELAVLSAITGRTPDDCSDMLCQTKGNLLEAARRLGYMPLTN
ncbi:MAG: N-acetylmuramic acid 6-phosphate etherase [Eubacteriales bacterium]|nr:N-acetylmuramic acid 6-phosphate etherase [Eubacteriales bacterium]